MREIIIIAGPNGAGKTSFAREYLTSERRGFSFTNADEIARTLATTGLSRAQADIAAARIMLDQIEAHVTAGAEFVLETTLASLTYAPKISAWRDAGYRVVLFYLRHPDAEAATARVRRRVAAGGHDIPEGVICRRFAKA
jgi:predicted ABC-type ATPase